MSTMPNLPFQPDTVISLPQIFKNDDIGVSSNPLYNDQARIEDDVATENEPVIPLTISTPRESILRAPLRVLHVTFGPIPYYPITHPDGHMYVHSLQNEMRTPKEIFDNVQYCHRRKWGPKNTKSPFFGNIDCIRETHRCTGIKVCEYLHPEIRNIRIRQVDSIIWEHLTQFGVQDWDINNKKRQALSWFLGNRNKFIKGTSCKDFQAGNCWYIFIQRDITTTSGVRHWGMKCRNQIGFSGRNHFFQPLDPKYNSYTDFLQQRAQEEPNSIEFETCSFITSTAAKAKYCGIDHIQGQGRLEDVESCPVIFDLITPKDSNRIPYILWSSIGEHNHAPPPTHKVPSNIRQDIIDCFIRMNDPSLTINRAIVNEGVREWLNEHGVTTFGQLHPALNNHDRIGLCILYSRLSIYPHGQSIGGVQHEYFSKHKYDQNRYIQKVFFDGTNLAVFCFYREQAILLAEQASFEIDMGFKRVRDNGITEIVFAKFVENVKKVITFARIFVNSDTTQTYRWIFTEFHNLLQNEFGITLRWRHHDHSAKLIAIVMDQDPKQMAGFGGYLQTQDLLQRSWQFQAQSSIVFCKVHYQRGVEKLVGKPSMNRGKWETLMDIPNCQTKEEYMHMCDLIIGNNSWGERVQNWAKYLKQETIASGLNKFCSRMNHTDFESIRSNSNAVEVAHWRGNSVGRRCSLLQAIRNSQALDLDEVGQYTARTSLGISLDYRKKAMSDRHELVLSRNYSRRTKEIQDRQLLNQVDSLLVQDNTLSIPIVLQGTSSSGIPKKLTKPKSPKLDGKQSRTGSNKKKRLRSLTVDRDHEHAQYERDKTVNVLQEELCVRRAILEIRQKERELDLEQKTSSEPVAYVEQEGQKADYNLIGSSFKTVWNGIRRFI